MSRGINWRSVPPWAVVGGTVAILAAGGVWRLVEWLAG